MLSDVFHAWERRLAAAATDRTVRPFEWGLDWIDRDARDAEANELERWAGEMVAASDRFFALPPCSDYVLEGDRLAFPSAIVTPHDENNLVRARYLPGRLAGRPPARRASSSRNGTPTPTGTWACAAS